MAYFAFEENYFSLVSNLGCILKKDCSYSNFSCTVFISDHSKNVSYSWKLSDDSKTLTLIENEVERKLTKVSNSVFTLEPNLFINRWNLVSAKNYSEILYEVTINNEGTGSGFFSDNPSHPWHVRISLDRKNSTIYMFNYPYLMAYGDGYSFTTAQLIYQENPSQNPSMMLGDGPYLFYTDLNGQLILKTYSPDGVKAFIRNN